VFVGHDYQPNGRPVAWETTIGASKRENPHMRADTPKAQFVEMRTSRDKTLKAPRLLFPSVQVNVDAGRLPPAHANGGIYLNIPLSQASNPAPYTDVDPQFVNAHRGAMLAVDVREPNELTGELGHISGVQGIPLTTLLEQTPPWDRNREIVLICRSGGRSARAATELAKKGFKHLYNMKGGMIAWNEARLPVER
jgi:rhodanese-related sulfurtransferase